MAIKKTTDGKGGVSIKDACIVPKLLIIDLETGKTEIRVRLYKDQASYDSNNLNNEVKHDIAGADLTTLLAASATKGIGEKVTDFLKKSPYAGAVDYL